MLGKLWNRIDRLNIKRASKYRLFRIALEIPAGLLGLLVWLLIRAHFLGTWDWMLCFIGYPLIVIHFVSVFYSCRHDFRGRKRKGS